MNIGWQGFHFMTAGQGGLFGNSLMKSTAQRMERQAQRDNQVAVLEKHKANLKKIECSSPKEAARILEMMHSYEEQIAAVRQAYNNSQMFHLMDEAREQGEKIAKAIEKSAPKTAEERKKEAMDEALGTDEKGGVLSEILDELTEEMLEESLENLLEPEAEAALNQKPTPETEIPAETA